LHLLFLLFICLVSNSSHKLYNSFIFHFLFIVLYNVFNYFVLLCCSLLSYFFLCNFFLHQCVVKEYNACVIVISFHTSLSYIKRLLKKCLRCCLLYFVVCLCCINMSSNKWIVIGYFSIIVCSISASLKKWIVVSCLNMTVLQIFLWTLFLFLFLH
jgi:hypothetical protein